MLSLMRLLHIVLTRKISTCQHKGKAATGNFEPAQKYNRQADHVPRALLFLPGKLGDMGRDRLLKQGKSGMLHTQRQNIQLTNSLIELAYSKSSQAW